jgi:hypothetical protein
MCSLANWQPLCCRADPRGHETGLLPRAHAARTPPRYSIDKHKAQTAPVPRDLKRTASGAYSSMASWSCASSGRVRQAARGRDGARAYVVLQTRYVRGRQVGRHRHLPELRRGVPAAATQTGGRAAKRGRWVPATPAAPRLARRCSRLTPCCRSAARGFLAAARWRGLSAGRRVGTACGARQHHLEELAARGGKGLLEVLERSVELCRLVLLYTTAGVKQNARCSL